MEINGVYMSRDGVGRFLKRMKIDEAFRDAVIRIGDRDARIAFINRNGFDCTLDEILQFPEELAKEESPDTKKSIDNQHSKDSI